MPDGFNPLHKWLGIPLKDQPPHYYRLLGLEPFESDQEVIDAAAKRLIAFVQGCAKGDHAAEAKKLARELGAARQTLLSPRHKEAYDAWLNSDRKTPPPSATPTPVASPQHAAMKPASAKATPAPSAARPASEIPTTVELAAAKPTRVQPAAIQAAPVQRAKPLPPATNAPPARPGHHAAGAQVLPAAGQPSTKAPPPVQAPLPARGGPPAPPPPAPPPPGIPPVPPSAATDDWSALSELESAVTATPIRHRKSGKRGQAATEVASDSGEKRIARGKGKRNGPTPLILGFIGVGVLVVVTLIAIAIFRGGDHDKKLAKADGKSAAGKKSSAADESDKTAAEDNEKQATDPTDKEQNGSKSDAKPTKAGKASGDEVVDATGTAKANTKRPAGDRVDGTTAVASLAIDSEKLAAGGTDSASGSEGDKPQTALLDAARSGKDKDVDKIREALAAGASVETKDSQGRSLLRLAVIGGSRDLAEFLLSKKADVNTADLLGETPLMSVAQAGNLKLVSLLLNSGAKPNQQTFVDEAQGSGGLTALHAAIRKGNKDVVKMLLDEKTIDPNLATAAGVTPLMLACWCKDLPIVQLLMLKQSKVDLVDADAQTALMYAVEGGDEAVVKQLLSNGDIMVSTKRADGATALSIALGKKSLPIAALLREAVKREAPMLDF